MRADVTPDERDVPRDILRDAAGCMQSGDDGDVLSGEFDNQVGATRAAAATR